MSLSISDCIDLALRNNRNIDSAYLDRILQRYNLKVAEDKFIPKPYISIEKNFKAAKDESYTYTITRLAGITITEALPTGANINLSGNYSDINPKDKPFSQNTSAGITFSQPLLKGLGIDLNNASIKTAEINEKINVLSLKSKLIDMVISVISAYRAYFQSIKQLEISRLSVENSKKLVEINKELIAAGRMAKIEIVQTEADIATREVSLIATENSVDAARLALIKLLEIGRHVKINPTEQITINEDMVLNAKELKETAFKNRIDFLTSNLNLEIAKMNLGQAKNNMLPDLSLTGGYRHNRTFISDESYSPSQSENWDAGIKFTVPLKDLTLKQGYLNAKINFKKTETGISQLKENIEIEVEDSIRTAEMKLRQVKLAKQANKLSRQKLDIENEKLKAGRSSNFQILTYQNDLVTSQNNELNAIIDYLNSITNLHKTTGTTLEGWGIKIAERYLDEKSLE